MRMKFIRWLVGALLLAGLLVAALVDFGAPALGQAVLSKARESTGLPLRASGAHINFFRGLALEDVRLSAELGVGAYEARAERVLFEHRPLSLLRGRFVLQRVVVEHPTLLLRLGPRSAESNARAPEVAPPPAPTPDESSRAVVARKGESTFEVEAAPSEVRLVGGTLRFRDRDGHGPARSVDGLDLTLRDLHFDRRAITVLHGIAAVGDLRMGELGLGDLSLRDLTSRIELDNGRVGLEALRFKTTRGELRGRATVDFNSLPFRYRLEVDGDRVDVPLLGRAALHLEAEGFGADAEHMSGEGALVLPRGRLPDALELRQIDPELAGLEHDPAEIAFRLAGGELHLRPFSLEAPPFELLLRGGAELGGELDFALALRRDGQETRFSLSRTLESLEINRRSDR